MSQENVEIVLGLFDAARRGDMEAALRLMSPDAEWVSPANAMEPGTRSGLSGVRTAFEALRDSFGELRYDIRETVDLGDSVLLTGTFSGVGRTSGAAFGPQTFGAVVTLAGGKVQRYEWYLSLDEAREAAGLSE